MTLRTGICFDDYVMSIISKYICVDDVPIIIMMIGKRTVLEYADIIGEKYIKRSYLKGSCPEVMIYSAKWSCKYAMYNTNCPWPRDHPAERVILTSQKWTFHYYMKFRDEELMWNHIKNMSPKWIYKYFEADESRLYNKKATLTYLLKTSPKYAAKFAINFMKCRWHSAEPVIFTDPVISYEYIKKIIRCRVPEAEEIISTDAYSATMYAIDIIRGQWPVNSVAHNTILQSPTYACMYAIKVIRGRWLNAEEIIGTDAKAACRYALSMDIIWNKNSDTYKMIFAEKSLDKKIRIYKSLNEE